MNREELAKALKSYRTPFEEEQLFVQQFIELTDDPLAFHRDRKEGHFTASAWIVNKTRTHALLTHHRKLNRWLQLGGHADGNENLLEVAMNEAREESGLISLKLVDRGIFDIDKHIIPANAKDPQHFHYDVRFLIEAAMDEPLTISEESKDLAWVKYETIPDVVKANDSILRMLEKTSKSEVVC
ncbi:NUDIX hydrolase [Echinicola vietnamensis]|uniref:ADP-ribose pyrophosphatase n=1 Tax=Echinicola vietnamensis (strain DSM 17526 / LMG 23754 / KMM 6221) TaxID=926556 RepID=L0FV51_ECHVK|nr:NUDIX hydrolase [Echinicola vietnamensis]AGA76631.1 ADP-ribose pyrophosphatase [Echinicola vietnamensis DSM 17526]